jgi:hypothetical protein
MNAFVYVCICIGQLRDAVRGAIPDSNFLILDASIGTLLLVINLRFLLNVAKENYKISATSA